MNWTQKVFRRASTFLMALFISLSYFLPMVCSKTYDKTGTPQTLSSSLEAPTSTIIASVASSDGDTLRAYRVINVTYNAATNDFTEVFSTSFADYLASTAGNTPNYSSLTVSSYYSATSDSVTLNSYLSGFAAYVKSHEGTLGTDYYQTISDSSGNATFSNVKMGQYLIVGWGSTAGPKVYSIATAEVVPEVSGSNYILYPTYLVSLKTTEPSIGKDITGGTTPNGSVDSASIGDTISYKIQSTIPTYPVNSVVTKYEIGDTLSAGLTLNESSIKVYATDGSTDTELVNGGTTYYTLTHSAQSFTVALDYSKISTHSGIKVTYSAVLNANAIVGENTSGNPNVATLKYSSDPFNNSLTYTLSSPPVIVYTYGLMINKYVDTTMSNRLAGAEFKIYTDSLCTHAVTDFNHADVVLTTNADGFAFYAGLESGIYYLKETKAPTGYNLLETPTQFTVGGSGSLITSPDGTLMKTYTSDSTGNARATRTISSVLKYGWIDTSGKLVWDASENTPPSTGALKAYEKNSISASNTVSSFSAYDGSSGFCWTNVSNARGVTLPSTGGIGTTIFTIVGLILVVGAAVLLITKARIANKRKS